MGLSLVSVNIERAKHYDRLFPFIKSVNPDVICFQELFERDIEMFEREFGGTLIYEPIGLHPTDPPEEGFAMGGIGIFSKLPIIGHEVHYYAGTENEAHDDEPARKPGNRAALFVQVEHEGSVFDIGTTHFTWTPDGGPSDEQRADLTGLLKLLDMKRSFVLTGDFNAPRGGEIFNMIAAKYKDNIPAEYVWSLDMGLHRAANGGLQEGAAAQGLPGLMVDGLFSTPEYTISDVRMHDGISDHCAIVAQVTKA